MNTVLVTGGAGFIGSHIIDELVTRDDIELIVNIDKLGIGSNIDNVSKSDKVITITHDIADKNIVLRNFERYKFTHIIHAAAESHVDRSIADPLSFVQSNVVGTSNILEAIRIVTPNARMVHVSTDEVYGHLGYDDPPFTEKTSINPRSPYSASKAASDLMVLSYINTYGINAAITRCCNNYGPRQHSEKLIPTIIRSIVNKRKVPVYGDGKNEREWIYVADHAKALVELCFSGYSEKIYNIPGIESKNNLEMVATIYDKMKQIDNRYDIGDVIEFVQDRPGHDTRYALETLHSDIKAINKDAQNNFTDGIIKTLDYYLDHEKES